MSKNFFSAQGLSRRKAILIGVLAIVLISVIVVQITPGPPPVTARKTKKRSTAPPAETLANRQGLPAADLAAVQATWPEYSLESTLAYNPFRPPDWLAPSEQNGREVGAASADDTQQGTLPTDLQLLAELQASGVSLVMITDDERVAWVGPRALRVGDNIGGFVVQEINTNGVILAQDDPPK